MLNYAYFMAYWREHVSYSPNCMWHVCPYIEPIHAIREGTL